MVSTEYFETDTVLRMTGYTKYKITKELRDKRITFIDTLTKIWKEKPKTLSDNSSLCKRILIILSNESIFVKNIKNISQMELVC